MKLHQEGKFPIEDICKFYRMRDLGLCLDEVAQGKASQGSPHCCKAYRTAARRLTYSQQVIKPILEWD